MNELLLGIQSMALDPNAWAPTVRRLADYVGAERALFFSPSPDANHLPGTAVGLDPEILREYAEHWYQYDIWTHRADAFGLTKRPQVILGDELVSHRDFLHSTVYNECLRRNGVARLMSAMVLPARRAGEPVQMVGAFYRPTTRAAFGERERRRYAALLPHLALAMQTYSRIARLESSLLLWQWSAERMADAVLFLAGDGRVLHMTGKAAELLCQSTSLRIIGGRLTAVGAGIDRKGLAKAFGESATGLASRAVIQGGPGQPDISLTVVPVPHELAEAAPAPRVATLVFMTANPPRAGELASSAKDRWSLTSSETRVLKRLLGGAAPRQIAAELGIAVSTVRTHLKRLYAKSATASQRELLAEVARLRRV